MRNETKLVLRWMAIGFGLPGVLGFSFFFWQLWQVAPQMLVCMSVAGVMAYLAGWFAREGSR